MTDRREEVAQAFRGLAEEEVRFRDELTLLVSRDSIRDALVRARDLGFLMLTDLTAVDRHPAEPRFEVVYLLTALDPPARLRLAMRLPGGDPTVPTAVEVYPGANWLEREVYDMFGIRFLGHPDLKRILMPDDWEGHPLRKDYPLVEEPVQFFGHTPKPPSAIIPRTPPRKD
ncbi:MAG: NADH-quinone oxidoreductase subunit C [Armatimonadota bacterium]|nr:NADH-quinone oxidoreductase subunit C [Armatimonadota bacterium]MDR7451859.1 NADH-quinone oxidoreductase subunit C [Armatimonadota bacterium]MDR7467584.1 NADH-quinone oxidoreductase subunit C [Armatimonadota bacterium]MDR7494455.1 NADH-quinone oxidoreductase subunit C [Armatimonadota bacterium]MDR7499716.1 NADH-quinone oxidoreductase subunit C [Armatimonadota bacterium]